MNKEPNPVWHSKRLSDQVGQSRDYARLMRQYWDAEDTNYFLLEDNLIFYPNNVDAFCTTELLGKIKNWCTALKSDSRIPTAAEKQANQFNYARLDACDYYTDPVGTHAPTAGKLYLLECRDNYYNDVNEMEEGEIDGEVR